MSKRRKRRKRRKRVGPKTTQKKMGRIIDPADKAKRTMDSSALRGENNIKAVFISC